MTNSNASKILVCGNTTLDIVLICREPYNSSGKRNVAEMRSVPGGQAANVADLLASLGNSVSFIGAFGGDSAAKLVEKDFYDAGVDIAFNRSVPVPHHTAFLRVDDTNGERFIDMYKHPQLNCDDVFISTERMRAFDCLYIDNHEPSLSLQLAKIARQVGVPVVADLENITKETSKILPQIDVLIAPSKIITDLVGDGLEQSIVRLANKHKVVVATQGERGCIGAEHDGSSLVVVPAEKIQAVDTTGAGDAFHAAFTHAMLKGGDIQTCMEFANKLAAFKCSFIGPRIPRAEAKRLSLEPITASRDSLVFHLRKAANKRCNDIR